MANLQIVFTLIFFGLGTIAGSFISMLNYRTKHNIKGKILGRSFCPHCKIQLKPYDMIPLLSYLFLRGKCRSCNKPLSINYLLVEILTGLVFASVFLSFNFLGNISPWETAFWLATFGVGLAIFFFDIDYLEVPIPYSIALTLLCAIGGYTLLGNSVFSMITGALIGKLFFYAQYAISKGTWVGLGDSDIGLALGLLLGPKMLLVALMTSYILGSIIGIILLSTTKANGKTQLPFGPFLITGLYVTVLYGEKIVDWYLNFSLI